MDVKGFVTVDGNDYNVLLWLFTVQVPWSTIFCTMPSNMAVEKEFQKRIPLSNCYPFTVVKMVHTQWHNWKIQSIQWERKKKINILTVFTRNHQQTNWPFHFLNNCVDVLKSLSWVLIWPWLKWQVEPCPESIFINKNIHKIHRNDIK